VGGNLATLARREDIADISLRYGFRSAHALLEALFGLALVALGLPVVWQVAHWFLHGGVIFQAEVLVLGPALIGLSLIVDAGRRGPYLLVGLRRGRRKIAFRPGTPTSEAKAFCRHLAAE
jgi:hypothetical protein